MSEHVIKASIRSNENFVRIEFANPIAWFEMPKPQALTFAFTILEHCGVKIEHQIQQDPAHE